MNGVGVLRTTEPEYGYDVFGIALFRRHPDMSHG